MAWLWLPIGPPQFASSHLLYASQTDIAKSHFHTRKNDRHIMIHNDSFLPSSWRSRCCTLVSCAGPSMVLSMWNYEKESGHWVQAPLCPFLAMWLHTHHFTNLDHCCLILFVLFKQRYGKTLWARTLTLWARTSAFLQCGINEMAKISNACLYFWQTELYFFKTCSWCCPI